MNRGTTRKDTGVLAKFRELPGARLAVAAFLVTVVVGLGGPPAYAWWSQQGNAEITARSGKLVTPSAPGTLRCHEPGNGNNVRPFTTVSWPIASGNGAVLDVVALGSNGKERKGVRSYAIPPQTTEVRLADLPGVVSWLDATSGNSGKLEVEVRNVWLDPPVKAVQLLGGKVIDSSPAVLLEGLMLTNNDGFKC